MVSLVSPLYPTKKNKANALEIIGWGETICLNCNNQSKSTNSTTLYHKPQQKKTNEFKPPELPYCKIKRADWEGVVIDYYPSSYNKTGKYYTLRWAVENVNWYTIGGASVDYLFTAGYNVELGSRDKAYIQDCLIKASRKVLSHSGWCAGSCNPYGLVIEKIDGNVFDRISIDFDEP